MAHSGATQTIVATARAGGRLRRAPDWGYLAASVRGPLLTLVTLIGLDQLARHREPLTHPFPLLLLTVAYAAYAGGLLSAVVSAVLTGLYAAHFLSDPGTPLHYSGGNSLALLVTVVGAVGVAVLVSRLRVQALRGRADRLERAEAEALDRRVSFLTQASATLASSLDYEVTLRELTRIMVPALADWCTAHVAGPDGTLRFVAGAHRDPARDLVVRALCEYGDRRLPFGHDPRDEPALVEVTEELLRERASDAEHLKVYRALAPSGYIRVPLRARGKTVGMLTLVSAREYGRAFEEKDLRFAVELGDRAALAVDAGRLYREAADADRRYRLLFDANPQPMWVFDVDSLAFLAVNDAAVRHYGYSREEFLGMAVVDLRPEEDVSVAGPGFERSHKAEAAFARHERKDGSVVDMEIISHPLELDGRRARLVLATDISDRTRVRAALHQQEEQLRQAQRLDAVGRLASGVAHDFNNLLTTIRGFSDMLLRDLPPHDRLRTDVEQIRKAADRGALLTGQLLTFGQREAPEVRVFRVNQVVGAMEPLVRRLLSADVKVTLRLGARVGAVRMDPGHLEQVLVNLVLNARDAMPDGGSLTIETLEREIGKGARARHVRPGPYVVLAVRDSGTGMDAEAVRHLFEPFQSGAAAQHRRSGLGLSIVHGIVRQNGGVVRVASEPGHGTTVKVYLPQVEAEEEAAEDTAFELRGGETVLVAEDEEGVRELLRKVLGDHGHAVLDARHGRDALMVAERYERPIDLLIADVVMPEIGGGELVERLRSVRPDLKVLYISGYTNDEIVRRGVRRTEAHFLQKPFTSQELMRKVRQVLDGEPTPLAS
ncbi:MAG TPA: ATP-binding protein [Gemmatimonadales bacterium]|nr:ATP-binding protein [Gemmatimonadales bacterium]